MRNPEIDEYQDTGGFGDAFPIGMRVLVVDDDPLCLMILKKMLLQCKYQVTACSRAIEALQLLREKKTKFDLVISDVYMPDIDGFKLLELIGLEMDLPVIMMSANGETSVVMKGITHGACDYLLKPVRMEELRNIWQHVVRKRGGMKDSSFVKEESSGEWDESERFPEYSSKKRKEKFEISDDQIDDISGLKKPRVVWSGDLHRLFVKAVNQLGVEKAVPKRILEIMNVQGLTRENVASHLQKYRLGLKRLSGVDLEPHPIASFQADESGSFGGAMCVRPPGSKSSSSRSSSSSGVFGKGVNQLDPGTLAALKQLQSMQKGNSAQVLKGSRALKMRQTAFDRGPGNTGLHRTASIELGSLKVHDEWTRWPMQQQHHQRQPGLESPGIPQSPGIQHINLIKEERLSAELSSPGSGSTVEEMDIGAGGLHSFGLTKIAEENPATAGVGNANILAAQELSDYCLEGPVPEYFGASPSAFSLSHVFSQQQQDNWSTDF